MNPPVEVSPSEFGGGPNIDAAVDDIINMLGDDGEVDGESPREEAARQEAPAPVITPPAAVVPPVQVVTPTAPQTPAAPVTAAPVETPVGAPPAAPVVASPVQPAPVAPAVESSAPVQPAAVAPTPQAAATVDPITNLANEVSRQRAELEPKLAALYTPSPEELQDFLENPGPALGKLAARLHMELVQNTLGVLAQQTPIAVQGVLEAQKRHDALEGQFFAKWPQLQKDNPQHKQAIMQMGQAYLRANPTADAATRINQIGAQVIVALGLLPTQTPVATAPVVPQPFAPASTGQAPAGSPQEELGGWAAINKELATLEYGD